MSSSFMYEINEYYKLMRIQIICMESWTIKGSKQYMFENKNQKLPKTVEQQPKGQLLPKMLVFYSFIYDLKEYHYWIWLLIVEGNHEG